MKAVQFDQAGAPEVLVVKEIKKPTVKPNEVLIKVDYAGVNFLDIYIRTGRYPSYSRPLTTGVEAAGVIEDIGSAVPPEFDLHVGDKVAGMAMGGATAEYWALDCTKVLKLPEWMSTKEGAAIILQGLTALTFLKDACDIKKGDTVLIQAAAGGTGGMLVQIAKALGCIVIGTTSTPEKAELARSLGADHIILYTRENIVEKVMKITHNKGVEAVLSGVGKDTFEADLACVRRKGTFVSFGDASGSIREFNPRLLTKRNIRFVRPALFGYIEERDEFLTRSNELLQLVKTGAVKIIYGGEYDLSEVSKAHSDLAGRKTTGKLLIRVH